MYSSYKVKRRSERRGMGCVRSPSEKRVLEFIPRFMAQAGQLKSGYNQSKEDLRSSGSDKTGKAPEKNPNQLGRKKKKKDQLSRNKITLYVLCVLYSIVCPFRAAMLTRRRGRHLSSKGVEKLLLGRLFRKLVEL